MTTIYKVEPFGGTTDAVEFIRKFEALSLTWTEEERCLRLPEYLTGPSSHWMEFLQKGGTLTQKLFDSPDIKKWADLKKAFLEEFEPNNSMKLYTIEQGPDEPGFTFLFRVLKLLNEQSYSKGSGIIELIIDRETEHDLQKPSKEGETQKPERIKRNSENDGPEGGAWTGEKEQE
jgi:hypothetical protein